MHRSSRGRAPTLAEQPAAVGTQGGLDGTEPFRGPEANRVLRFLPAPALGLLRTQSGGAHARGQGKGGVFSLARSLYGAANDEALSST